MDEQSLFVKFWTHESRTTRNVLARIPEDSDYRPDPKSRTAQRDCLADRLRGTDDYRCARERQGRMDAASDAGNDERSARGVRAPERRDGRRWKAVPADRWNGTLEFFGRQRPASPMAWSFLFDIVHHRGQITTYLRPMGRPCRRFTGRAPTSRSRPRECRRQNSECRISERRAKGSRSELLSEPLNLPSELLDSAF